MPAIAARIAAVTGAVRENRAPLRRTAAMSAFRPRTRTDLPAIFVWPNLAPCFSWPWTRFWVESMSMKASTSAPGSSGASRVSRAGSSRPAFSGCRTFPQA
jgi:hypothetical protein